MSIKIECAGCRRALKVKAELAGKVVKCPVCSHRLSIPAGERTESASVPTSPDSPAIGEQAHAEAHSVSNLQGAEEDQMQQFLESLSHEEQSGIEEFPDVTNSIPQTAAGEQGFFRLTSPPRIKTAGLVLIGCLWLLTLFPVMGLVVEGNLGGALVLLLISTVVAAGLFVLAIGTYRDFQIEPSTGAEQTLLIIRSIGFIPSESRAEIAPGTIVRHTSAVYTSSPTIFLFGFALLFAGMVPGVIYWFFALQERKIYWVEIAGGTLEKPVEVLKTPDIRHSNEVADNIASLCQVRIERGTFRGPQGLLSFPPPSSFRVSKIESARGC